MCRASEQCTPSFLYLSLSPQQQFFHLPCVILADRSKPAGPDLLKQAQWSQRGGGAAGAFGRGRGRGRGGAGGGAGRGAGGADGEGAPGAGAGRAAVKVAYMAAPRETTAPRYGGEFGSVLPVCSIRDASSLFSSVHAVLQSV
jgi:hypothetical protein